MTKFQKYDINTFRICHSLYWNGHGILPWFYDLNNNRSDVKLINFYLLRKSKILMKLLYIVFKLMTGFLVCTYHSVDRDRVMMMMVLNINLPQCAPSVNAKAHIALKPLLPSNRHTICLRQT